MSENRRLAAIMFTDIVGYTTMMQISEHQTLTTVKKHRQVLETCTSRQDGRVIQYYGDGSLSIYKSGVQAVECALEVQKILRSEPSVPLRIGIHIGEILEKEGHIYGSGVNLAARIQAEGIAGSILISGAMYEAVRNQSELKTVYLGSFELKNVAEPQAIHAIANNNLPIPEIKAKSTQQQSAPVTETPNNLPKLFTAFFGREQELDQIYSLILSNRLCTLTGTGGIGKTRLSIELGRRLMDQFPQGVYFIDLVPVPAGSSDSIANVPLEFLEVRAGAEGSSIQILSNQVEDKKILFILDNCEHLIEESANFVRHMLTNTISPHFLVTSRTRLNIEGEQVWPLATLSLPPQNMARLSTEVRDFDSIQLFMDRVHLIMPGFNPKDADWNCIIEICNYLDGIPLAIELAAARIRSFPPKILLERLKQSFNILQSRDYGKNPRQQTIQNLIEWSYQLLSEKEQQLFLNLSVFPDSFDLVCAEEVCVKPPIINEEVIDLIDLLIDQSLVIPIPGNRYRLLEVVKQFGRNYLQKTNQWEDMVESLYQFLLQTAAKAYRMQLKASEESLENLHQEHENIINVLEWISDQPEKQFELTSYLGWYWMVQFQKHRTGFEYLKAGINRYRKRDLIRGRALADFGKLSHNKHRAGAEEWIKESISILHELPISIELATAYFYLGELYSSFDDYQKGEESLLKANKIANELGDLNFQIRASTWLCYGYIARSITVKAIPILEENLALAIRESMKWDILLNRHFYADCALIEENFKVASERYREAAIAAVDIGDQYQTVYEVQGLAMSMSGLGQPESALFLAEVAKQRFVDLNVAPHPANWWDRLLKKHIGAARDMLGEESAAHEASRGKNTSFEFVIQQIREGVTRF